MADIFDRQKRREIMQAIRSKDTRPEWLVRRCLHGHGFRYRLHDRRLPGRPDLVLRKYGLVILVQGCFWHGHDPCKIAKLPKSNRTWWEKKIQQNRERDQRTVFLLETLGWKVWSIYECELRTLPDRAQTLGRLLRFLYTHPTPTQPGYPDSTVRYGLVEEELCIYEKEPIISRLETDRLV
jgi:DNA mismatch endonuclease (patch repair protein)